MLSNSLRKDSAGQPFLLSVVCGSALIVLQGFMGLFTAILLRLSYYICVLLLIVASVFLPHTLSPHIQ